jgi:hypothetical protein
VSVCVQGWAGGCVRASGGGDARVQLARDAPWQRVQPLGGRADVSMGCGSAWGGAGAYARCTRLLVGALCKAHAPWPMWPHVVRGHACAREPIDRLTNLGSVGCLGARDHGGGELQRVQGWGRVHVGHAAAGAMQTRTECAARMRACTHRSARLPW